MQARGNRDGQPDAHALRELVESRLDALLPDDPGSGELGAAVRYSLLAPAKRIRPILTVLAGWEARPGDLSALDAGCALEMVHTASLVLDDMPAMDDATERRGQAATHVRFGEDVAMLATIALMNQAYATLASMHAVSAEGRCAMIGILGRAIGLQGLAGGQYADLRPGDRREAHGIARTTHLKTGVMFVAAIDLAIAVYEMEHDTAARLRRCATELGQAFQIYDDIVDSTVALPSGRQEDEGKSTLLSLLGPDAARHRLRAHVDAALRELDPMGPLAGFVRTIFAGASRLHEAV